MQVRWKRVAGFGVVFLAGAIALNGVGCGDDDDGGGGGSGPSEPDAVTVVGDVDMVINETETTAAVPEHRWFAWIAPEDAIAQEDCPVDSILACLETNLDEQETPVASCNAISPLTCEFEVAIELVDDVRIFFVDDDGDGVREEEETESELQNPPERFCKGQTVTLSDVEINFDPTESSVALGVESDTECPTPTPTPEPTNTPEPTATPTP